MLSIISVQPMNKAFEKLSLLFEKSKINFKKFEFGKYFVNAFIMAFANVHSKTISITHFINPHLFWYRQIDDCNEDYSEILELEEQLNKYYKCQCTPKETLRRPALNSMVAVKFLSWNKFIRARLEHIASFTKNVRGGEYIMWAVDYGFPFQAKAEHMYRLPEQFLQPNEHIRRCGLVDILPAERDFIKDYFVTRAKECWHQRACDVMLKVINEADSVVLTEKFRTHNHTWGNLIVTTHLGVTFNMRDYLTGLNLAIDAESSFHEMCLRLKTTQILPWMTNSGSSKFSTNKLVMYPIEKVGIAPSSECDALAKRKVEDWHIRNRSATERSKEFLDTTDNDIQINNSFNELTAKQFHSLEACIMVPSSRANNQHMGLAGALSVARMQKYTERLALPPKPVDTSFDMSFEDKDFLRERYEKSVNDTINGSENSAPQIFKKEPLDNQDMNLKGIDENSDKIETPTTVATSAFKEYLIKIRKMYIERTNRQNQRDNINAATKYKIDDIKEDESFQVAEMRVNTTEPKFDLTELKTKPTFHGIKMVPAGFDLMNLFDYKDENHWHRKATTLHDHLPHDDPEFFY